MKKFMLFPCLLLAFALGSCTSTDEGDMTIELACPQLKAQVQHNIVTITWTAIPKTAGYSFRFDEGEYTQVEADVLSYTGKMTDGPHTFEIHAVGNQSHTTDSAVRKVEFSIDLTLPAPEPSATTDGEGTTVAWAAVPNAVGYAYSLDEAAEVTVAATIYAYKGKLAAGDHTFSIRALGDDVESVDSPVKTINFNVVDTSSGVFAKKTAGTIIKLTEGTPGVYTATIDCTAGDSFTILIDNVEHGFTAYGGNGGVGTVNSEFASVPFYNGFTYYVRESIGRLSKDGTLYPLWVNLGADAKVYLKIDRSNADGTPRYYLKLVENNASIILEQHFDLFSLGGDWVNKNKGGTGLGGTVTASTDGTETGTKGGAKTGTAAGIQLLTTQDADAVAAYLANRGMTGWSAENLFEFPGFVRLSVSGVAEPYGTLTTPELGAGAAGTLTVTFDGLRFASQGDMTVTVLGAGTISAASVKVNGSGSPVTITPQADGKSFFITTAHNTVYPNADQKYWSNFTFTIQGATDKTRICWSSANAGSGADGRYCLDNIVVKKN